MGGPRGGTRAYSVLSASAKSAESRKGARSHGSEGPWGLADGSMMGTASTQGYPRVLKGTKGYSRKGGLDSWALLARGAREGGGRDGRRAAGRLGCSSSRYPSEYPRVRLSTPVSTLEYRKRVPWSTAVSTPEYGRVLTVAVHVRHVQRVVAARAAAVVVRHARPVHLSTRRVPVEYS
jgi:hypothetical protein